MRRVVLPIIALANLSTPSLAQDVAIIAKNAQTVLMRHMENETTGAADADVVLIEYFDYNCPYCKRLAPALRELLGSDPKLALIYKDWPILGPVSVYAAQSALAAQWQGRYRIAHDALIDGPRLSSDAAVDALLDRAGVNMAILKRDRETHAAEIAASLQRTETEAGALQMQGTPGLLVGRQRVSAVPDLNELRRDVANVRQPVSPNSPSTLVR